MIYKHSNIFLIINHLFKTLQITKLVQNQKFNNTIIFHHYKNRTTIHNQYINNTQSLAQKQCNNQISTISKSFQNNSQQTNPQFIQFIHQLSSKLQQKKVCFQVQNSLDSLFQDTMEQWIHAGNHHGNVVIDSKPLGIVVDCNERENVFTLKLIEIEYKVQKYTNNVSSSIQRQKIVGKQNLFLKNYITKFKSKNLHRFQQKSHISADYTLQYDVFIQKTTQALDRVILQHKKLTSNIRQRKISQAESILSDNFSDKKINEIEIKGENRLSQHVTFVSPNALLGSQSKIQPQDFIFSSLNQKIPNKIIRSNRSNLVLKVNKVPMTDQKHQKNNNNNQQQYQDSIIQSPQLKSIALKKLSSQQVKPAIQLLSPLRLKPKRLPLITDRIEKYQTDEQKRKKLMQDFQIKRLQFKRRIEETKQKGKQRPKPETDRLNKKKERKLSRSSSTRSMRTVRLSELQKLPEQKPWVRKQKQITKVRNKKLLYAICIVMLLVVYLLMQPFKNVEDQTVLLPTKRVNEKQTSKMKNQGQMKSQNLLKRKNRFKLKEKG